MRIIQLLRNSIRFISEYKERTEPMGPVDMMALTNKVVATAVEKGQRTGRAVFGILPAEAQKVVTTCWFDPYNHHIPKAGIHHWLEHHVIFDKNGEIVGIHDYGEVLWTKNKEA